MCLVAQLMQRWLTGEDGPGMKEYHPKIQGFFTFLEKLQAKEGDPIYSIARIWLPFTVKPDFDRVSLGWKGASQVVLFVTLSATDRNYKKEDDVSVIQMSRAPTPAKSLHPPVSTGSSSKSTFVLNLIFYRFPQLPVPCSSISEIAHSSAPSITAIRIPFLINKVYMKSDVCRLFTVGKGRCHDTQTD